MLSRRKNKEQRSLSQLKEQYEIETELAFRLQNSSKLERQKLYSSLYDELFQRVPHHPQIRKKASMSIQLTSVHQQYQFLKRFLRPEHTFLEIGAGDCSLALEIAKEVKHVYAVDVSDEITESMKLPRNFHLILTDGCSIPITKTSIDVAYSNQLMEHLHPDDAFEQLDGIYRSLTKGGIYACLTPNRLSGPHDISKFFGHTTAVGLHLHEYTIAELCELFSRVGFCKIHVYAGGRGIYLRLPKSIFVRLESVLSTFSFKLRSNLIRYFFLNFFLGIRVVGTK
jgi:ubiquinone/menaquinone biosynthesis C-methylase UbiE